MKDKHKEKYLRLPDILELLLLSHRQGQISLDFIGKVFASLVVDANELYREKAITIICDYDQADLIFTRMD